MLYYRYFFVISILFIILIFFFLESLIFLNASRQAEMYSQTEQVQQKSNDWQIYDNQQYGFQMVYPNNWSAVQFDTFYSELNKNTIVTFVSPIENLGDEFSEYLSIKTIKKEESEFEKTRNDLTFKYTNYLNQTLSNFNSYKIYDNRSINDLLNNISNIENSYPYVIIYDFIASPPLINKKMEILLFYDDSIYIFEYGSSKEKFEKYLNTINKIISSFNKIT